VQGWHGHGNHVGRNLGVLAINAAELQDGRTVLGINIAWGGVNGVREVEQARLADFRVVAPADGNGCSRQ
jgi:hypothetical protein